MRLSMSTDRELEAYKNELAKQLELFKAELAKDLERHKANLQHELQKAKGHMDAHYDHWRLTVQSKMQTQQSMFRGLIDFALAATRAIIFVNGGAAIAILAFLGHVWGADSGTAKHVLEGAKPALWWFLAGVTAGMITAALAYLSQVLFAELRDQRPGNYLRVAAVVVAACGLFAFTHGAISAVDAFGTAPRPISITIND